MKYGTITILVATFLTIGSGTGNAEECAQRHKLLADDGAEVDHFSSGVAVSGTTAIVGAEHDDDRGNASGSAYIFDIVAGRQTAKLLAEDGATWDQFGCSVAIAGTIALVGAEWSDSMGANSGAAYLFDTNNGGQLAKLLPDDGAAEDCFGANVAISGTSALVGSRFDDDNGEDSGSAYLFDTTTGAQLAKLLPDDGAAEDYFGISVAISGTIALIGAQGNDDNGELSGSAYLFDTTTGTQLAKLLPDDGAREDYFGCAVAISETIALVGARGDDDSGSVYVFDANTGGQLAKLLADDGASGDRFGHAVAISGSTALVGAYGKRGYVGAAYLFDAPTGAQIAKLLPDDPPQSREFGRTLAMSGTSAVIGALLDNDNGPFSGSAYVFHCIHCRDRGTISRATCRNRTGDNRKLVVKLVRGVPRDSFTVELATGEMRAGELDFDGAARVKFKRLPGGVGSVIARWGCGADDSKPYTCP